MTIARLEDAPQPSRSLYERDRALLRLQDEEDESDENSSGDAEDNDEEDGQVVDDRDNRDDDDDEDDDDDDDERWEVKARNLWQSFLSRYIRR